MQIKVFAQIGIANCAYERNKYGILYLTFINKTIIADAKALNR